MKKIVHSLISDPLAVIFSLSTMGSLFGAVPYNVGFYYCMLIAMTIIAFAQNKNISLISIAFLLVCLLSIIVGNPLPVFNSWNRFGLFLLLFITVFPVFESQYMEKFRINLFKIYLLFISIIGISAPFCYNFGINYMSNWGTYTDYLHGNVGTFGGLTPHSMTLGLICALSAVLFCYISIHIHGKWRKTTVYICYFCSLCGCMVSASRAAFISALFGTIVLLYVEYKQKLSNLFSVIIILALAIVLLSPIYEPYMAAINKKQTSNIESGGSMFYSREQKWNNRIAEFQSSPLFGVGFTAVDARNVQDYDAIKGSIEPGSSWLAIFSMLGIAGGLLFFAIFIRSFRNLWVLSRHNYDDQLLLGLLSVFVVHMSSEGYVFSGGNFLCLFFWLLLGLGFADIKTLRLTLRSDEL